MMHKGMYNLIWKGAINQSCIMLRISLHSNQLNIEFDCWKINIWRCDAYIYTCVELISIFPYNFWQVSLAHV